MTKKIILLLIFSQFCFSQNHYSISVKYKTIVTTIKTDSTTTKHKDLVQEIINNLNIENLEIEQKELIVFKHKEKVPLKQFFALYAINKISTIANGN